MKTFVLSWSIAVALLSGLTAFGQTFPTKPIRIVVPVAPGGTTDIVARGLGARMSKDLGISVVVDNRPGASAIIGSDLVAKSSPDGYTLLMAGSPHAINKGLRKNTPYDPQTSFAPVSLIGTVPMVLTVHRSVPAQTYQEFVTYGKANPSALRCGITPASASHLASALFASMTGVPMLLVPYKGDSLVITDLLGGHINCVILISTQVIQPIRDGRFRALAVTTAKRIAILPDVPTLRELGLKDYEAGSWNAVFVAAGTPAPVVKKLADSLIRSARDPAVAELLGALGFEVRATDPQGLADFLASQITLAQEVAKAANITAQ